VNRLRILWCGIRYGHKPRTRLPSTMENYGDGSYFYAGYAKCDRCGLKASTGSTYSGGGFFSSIPGRFN
jgi:hypothetical protein